MDVCGEGGLNVSTHLDDLHTNVRYGIGNESSLSSGARANSLWPDCRFGLVRGQPSAII